MHVLRSERVSAALLLAAAALGLLLANLPFGPALIDTKQAHLDLPWLGIDLSIGHWISDGLLAIFFFIVAVELKRELVIGELNSLSKALLPAIAAVGGVIVPALIFLGFTAGTATVDGWPIPTATDIAFALGVLAMFGKFIPTRVRIFLLALAVLDDLIAILIIAFFFTSDANLAAIGFAGLAIALFGAVSRLLRPRSAYVLARRRQWPIAATLWVLGILAWYFVLQSGVHATIAGVALGFVMSRRPGGRAAHTLEPWSNGVVLPLFALSAAMVPVPQVRPSELDPAFWGILVGLPAGKILGITLAGVIGVWIARMRAGRPVTTARFGGSGMRSEPSRPLAIADLVTVGALGGVGFTVSLLMNELAFVELPEVANEGTLAVLIGSGISIVFAAILVSLRSRHYRRAGERAGQGGAFSR
ncbi:Na+/H+ antiporter NhaA [Agromyces aerolatus]|uniref:Na+/H+ antiporter NhaA n=1 Tax=Agromyces sp. LY-1074 TaxID=3074080 RepID=UPI002858F4C6|nr:MULTISPECIES: Na+/H+ antiporter NhaA [unclassified Agromyces]MDR5698827.1 Na+/H+ antiporter NhaA [Agromyces sp. LY-1074]MDR5705395.1 Na+/H+ antiporter NhaA [Agromyces sp. LY-1358]